MLSRTKINITIVLPVAVMTAFASAGRILFAPIPDFKPTTAIIILAGISFGPTGGFLTGIFTALCSNFFFGQGIWTLWQMVTWGIIGFLAGLLTKCKFLDNLSKVVAFGLFSGFLYGIIINTFNAVVYVRPLNFAAVFASFMSAFIFDFVHSISTGLFLFILYSQWLRKLDRIKKKYMALE